MKSYSRRWFLGSSAGAFGLVALTPLHKLLGQDRAARAAPRSGAPRAVPKAATPAVAEAPPPWALIAPYDLGARVTASWHIAGLSPVQSGSAILTLRHTSGREARIRLLRRGDAPIGVAQTQELDLLLMNHAKGNRRTNELLARVIRHLASQVAAREKAHPASRRVLSRLHPVPAHHC